MDLLETQGSVSGGDQEGFAAVADYCPGLLDRGIGHRLGGVYFEVYISSVLGVEDGPSGRVWGETSDEVVDAGCGLVPVYAAGLLEDLGGGTQFAGRDGILGDWLYAVVQDILQGLDGEVGAQSHKLVMHGAGIVGGQDWYALTIDYVAGVYLMLEEEGGHACFLVAVYDCPVDRSGTAVLRQEGAVQVEGSQARHVPYHLGEHSEGHYYLKIGLEGSELLDEEGVFQLFGLKEWDSLLHRILLDGAALEHAAVTAHGLVGHGYHTYYIITLLDKTLQRELRELGGSHKYYPQFLLLHIRYYIKKIWDIGFTLIPQKVQVRHCGMS